MRPFVKPVVLILFLLTTVGLGPAPVASADGSKHQDSGRLVTPHAKVGGLTGGDLTGEGWYIELSLPAEINPAFGNGERCVRLGRDGSALLAIGFGPPQTCIVEVGTAVYIIGITTFCSDVEPPPYFAIDEASQRQCALDLLHADTVSISLTVDGGDPVSLKERRFMICSPQREVQLLADNFLGVDPQLATYVACGWVAWLKDLPVGTHTIRSVATFTDGSEHVWEPVITVVPDD